MPFILTSPSSANITVAAVTELHQAPWIGKLELEDTGRWIDDILLLVKETWNSPSTTRQHYKISSVKISKRSLLQSPKKSFLYSSPRPLEGSATRLSTRESCPHPPMPKLRSPAMLEQYYARSLGCHHSSLGQQRLQPVPTLNYVLIVFAIFVNVGINIP